MSIVAKRLDGSRWHLDGGGLGPGHIVLDGMGTLLPSPTRSRTSSNFGPYFYCGQTAVCVRIPLGTEVGLSLGDIVLDGIPVSPTLEGHSPQFSANVYCGQMAGWTKMSLGMEVGLSPGDFVFDGTQFPQKRKHSLSSPPNFWPMSIVAKRLDGSRCHLVWR